MGSEEAGLAVSERPGPGRRRRLPPRRIAVAVGVALALVVAAAGWWLAASGPPRLTQADVDAAVQRGIDKERRSQQAAPPDAATAYQAIVPSLAVVIAQRPAGSGSAEALGSGVVVNAQGSVLTALHVVDGAARIEVDFSDGTATTARIASSQPTHDIAVLAVDELPQVVVPAVLGPAPAVGDPVFAVGDPLGLRYSLSAGVVSATGRTIVAPRGPPLTDLIQFDAAANPGNSGGPLLDRAGRVVGIVTALANPAHQDFFVGIAFAVPIATAAGGAGGPQQ